MTLSDSDLELYLGRDATGRVSEWWWRNQHELVVPGSSLSTWVVENRDGSRLICRRLPAETHGRTTQVEKLLDNEIRAMSRLAHRYGRGNYPAELPRLVGYNFDTVEPYVLCAPFRGTCAEEAARNLLSDQRIAFVVGLLRALAQLAAVDLVHGDVGLSTTWWDDSRVQLVNFECAAVTGEPRRCADHSRWASPNQILGTGRVHPGDDVFSAGLVIYELLTGTRPTGEHKPDLTTGGPLLRELLAGVFQPDPERRPSAVELLRRLSTGGDLPAPMDVEAGLRAGRVRFEQARRSKYLPDGETSPVSEPLPRAHVFQYGVPTSGEPPRADSGPAAPRLTTWSTAPVPSARPAGTSSVKTALVIGFVTVFVVSLVLAVVAELL